ncbi:MAG: DUF6056 family protein [Prevotella sp.]|jgi:hypothetical protein|nr:DUF6056 family protein [Prevotella sp.]
MKNNSAITDKKYNFRINSATENLGISRILSKKKKLPLMVASALCVFVLIYVLNCLYPLFADDWNYSFVYGNDNARIKGVPDIVRSQYNHYMMWGGRSVVHFIAQMLLMLDFSLTCILNASAYTALIYLVYIIANKNNRINPVLFFTVNMLVWFAQPSFCATVLWKTGAANYLWGTLIVLLFIYPCYSCYSCRRSRETKDGTIKVFCFLILGIIAGWTNENTSLGLTVYLLLSLILLKKEKTGVPKWMISGCMGVIAGAALMIAAPGNFVRAKVIHDQYYAGASCLDMFLTNLDRMLHYSLHHIMPLIITFLILLAIYWKYPKTVKSRRSVIQSSLLFLVLSLVAFSVMIVSPAFPERALFGIITFLIISSGIIYANIDLKARFLKRANVVCLGVLLLAFGVDYYRKFEVLNTVSSVWKERESLIKQGAGSEGNADMVFTKKFQVHPKYFIYDLGDDPDAWENTACAKFYGIKSVRVISPAGEEQK